MVDDGSEGDFKAGDGIYTRRIQIKESKAKTMTFLVVPESPEGPVPGTLPKVAPDQLANLEIKNRPSMIEILGQIWSKIKKGREKSENGGS
jgi:hypothetical protein